MTDDSRERFVAWPQWILVAALGVLLMLPHHGYAQAPGANPARTPSAENGKRLFSTHYCYACHGTLGQGGRDGARIAPNPPALATVVRYVRKPAGQMPPYTNKVLSDDDLADIVAFLKTIPPAPAVSSLPLLNQ